MDESERDKEAIRVGSSFSGRFFLAFHTVVGAQMPKQTKLAMLAFQKLAPGATRAIPELDPNLGLKH